MNYPYTGLQNTLHYIIQLSHYAYDEYVRQEDDYASLHKQSSELEQVYFEENQKLGETLQANSSLNEEHEKLSKVCSRQHRDLTKLRQQLAYSEAKSLDLERAATEHQIELREQTSIDNVPKPETEELEAKCRELELENVRLREEHSKALINAAEYITKQNQKLEELIRSWGSDSDVPSICIYSGPGKWQMTGTMDNESAIDDEKPEKKRRRSKPLDIIIADF